MREIRNRSDTEREKRAPAGPRACVREEKKKKKKRTREARTSGRLDTRAADVFTRASRAACAGRGAVPCAAELVAVGGGGGGEEALLPWESARARESGQR